MRAPAGQRSRDHEARRVAVVALAVGATLLGITLGVPKGGGAFYATGFALAGTWAVAYAFAPSRPTPDRRGLLNIAFGLVAGVTMFGVFVIGSLTVRHFGLLGDAVDDLLQTADSSPMPWVLALAGANGVAEELFFRGTLIDVVPRRMRFAAGVIPYTLTTVPSGNVALVIAAAVMGTVFTGLRLRTASLVSPIVSHLSWSALMITLLPR